MEINEGYQCHGNQITKESTKTKILIQPENVPKAPKKTFKFEWVTPYLFSESRTTSEMPPKLQPDCCRMRILIRVITKLLKKLEASH